MTDHAPAADERAEESAIPPGIEQAFTIAAGELGFVSASWLFVREAASDGGDARVSAMRDALGRSFPVLDAIADAWLDGERAPRIDVDAVIAALEGSTRVMIVGIEADHLDALATRLPASTEIALLDHSVIDADWDRVLANFRGRVGRTGLSTFHELAGARSAVLTFVYGHDGHNANVRPAWLRVLGPDVRAQFRAFVGWDVLPRPLYVYPRWLHEHPLAELTTLVGG